MPSWRPTRKALSIALAGIVGLYAVYLLFGWLALPHILQSQAPRIIAEKSAHRLAMDLPEFNPFALSLRVPHLRLETPEGQPLLQLDEAFVDVSAASLVRRALVLDDVRLAAPQVEVTLEKDGSLNWSRLIEALKSKEPQHEGGLPRMEIRRFALAGGRVAFADRRAGFETRVDPIDVELDDVSTLADENGRYRIAARTGVGAQFAWQGDLDLAPIASSGHLSMSGLDVAKLAPYLQAALPAAPAGIASFEADYRAGYADGRLALTIEHAKAGIKDLRVPFGRGAALLAGEAAADGARFDLARGTLALARFALRAATLELPRAAPQKLGDLAIEDVQANLPAHEVALGRASLEGGHLQARRSAEGRIDLIDAFAQALPPRAAAPKRAAAESAGAPWHVKAGKVEIAGLSATFVDQSVTPAATIALEDIRLGAENVSDDLAAAIPVQAGFRSAAGGSFRASGRVVPGAPSADLKLELADLALKPAEPYLASVAKLSIAGGRLSVEGRASYGKAGPAFKGGFALRDLRLDEAGTKNRFLIWKSLASKSVDATAQRLDLRELALEGLDASLLIGRDKTINLSRILRTEGERKPAAASSEKPAFVVNVARLRVARSELDFADQSLALPFGTRIHHLRGVVTGLSSRPGAPGLLELEGQVDDYGLARAAGRIELFNPTHYADLAVTFRNVEMTRLTPYSATFLGRRIASGKLSLDLRYKFDRRRVEGDNKVIMDRLTLGERIESPEAKNLPLDLAIAILQDSDGRIELGLPVSGSLDDPQFSYGGIVWKAIVNVLTKIATAPFRALASLFGGGEKMEAIAFEPGHGRLTPPEREKLGRVAAILNKRPGLALTVHGTWAETDRVALQERQLRRAVAQRAGVHVEGDEDPGPLSTQDPKVQSAIEALFADRFGRAELAALKEGFRKANPGQLPESAAGKMMSRLTTLFREQRTLGEDELAQLKGADFHAVLFERLREREPMPDERLAALAKARGEYAAKALAEAGAPGARLALGAPAKTPAEGRDIQLDLEVQTAAR